MLHRQRDSGTLRTASHSLLSWAGAGGGWQGTGCVGSAHPSAHPLLPLLPLLPVLYSSSSSSSSSSSRRQAWVVPTSQHPASLLPLQPCPVQQQEAGPWNCPHAHTSAHQFQPLRPASSSLLCSSSSCGSWGARPVSCGLALGKETDLKIFYLQTFTRTTPFADPPMQILIHNSSSYANLSCAACHVQLVMSRLS